MLTLRVLAVRKGTVSIGYFRLYPSDQTAPARALAAARHYDNLFQVPILFYNACVTSLAMGLQGPVALAWGFVALRVVHGFIHMGYYNVLHRFIAFMASNLLLVAMWVVIAQQLQGTHVVPSPSQVTADALRLSALHDLLSHA